MISLLDFYDVMRHSPLDTFVIYYDNDASFTLMRGECRTLFEYRFESAYVVEVIPEVVYNYNYDGDDEFFESLRVIAKLP